MPPLQPLLSQQQIIARDQKPAARRREKRARANRAVPIPAVREAATAAQAGGQACSRRDPLVRTCTRHQLEDTAAGAGNLAGLACREGKVATSVPGPGN